MRDSHNSTEIPDPGLNQLSGATKREFRVCEARFRAGITALTHEMEAHQTLLLASAGKEVATKGTRKMKQVCDGMENILLLTTSG